MKTQHPIPMTTIAAVCLLGLTTVAMATPAAISMRHELAFSGFAGKTYLEAMTEAQDGIKANLDADYLQEYKVTGCAGAKKAIANFDTKVTKKVMTAFGNDKEKLCTFADSIAKTSFTPATMIDVMHSQYEGSGDIYAVSGFFAMASGAGTLVRIDDNNYFYNYGYKSGEEADDVQSGRSYGAGPMHNANDASDVMYLNEIEQLLTSDENPKAFYTTILEALTASNVRGMANLSEMGQQTATDFLAIYTAELDRHVMVELKPEQHPWENDLLEATMVSIYSAASGKLVKDGALTDAPLRDFWAKSDVSNRSGIGIGRKDRRLLQREISAFMRENHADLVTAIDDVTGGARKDGDVFRGLAEYLNNYDTQADVKHDAKTIVKATVNFLVQVKQSAGDITTSIEK